MANENKEKKTGRFGQFFKEVSGEVKKLSWPTKKEIVSYTLTVIAGRTAGRTAGSGGRRAIGSKAVFLRRAGSGIRRGPRPACKPVIQETLI